MVASRITFTEIVPMSEDMLYWAEYCSDAYYVRIKKSLGENHPDNCTTARLLHNERWMGNAGIPRQHNPFSSPPLSRICFPEKSIVQDLPFVLCVSRRRREWCAQPAGSLVTGTFGVITPHDRHLTSATVSSSLTVDLTRREERCTKTCRLRNSREGWWRSFHIQDGYSILKSSRTTRTQYLPKRQRWISQLRSCPVRVFE